MPADFMHPYGHMKFIGTVQRPPQDLELMCGVVSIAYAQKSENERRIQLQANHLWLLR